ncbi:Hsp20/alpha crystallin family protein [Bermanella marisrubri]|uniref:Molecular chaperone (Small heat shock protein) n=1 Tax=Bermanella marisrubri TaxID=207949 RepID=Q1N5J3_9GAMM|nr:Hsp20/alpha crystallin family protein [Bermanella marisrubri]EAT13949.1 Molecular chaperone (small heat shock protein) [Oceanobacter sp. RED65] [Bermanella marisrubri]QIZ84700.1 Hsp20/alpha crystallin family protein [Bermanella marisrubri]
MKLTTWDPFREMEAVLDRYRPARGVASNEEITRSDWYPSVDVSETDAAFHIHAELPGVKKDDIKVTVHDGILTLSGQRENVHEQKDKKVHRVERSFGSFRRSFTLPDNVQGEDVQANFQDGVLEVDIPKVEKQKPKQVEVQVK